MWCGEALGPVHFEKQRGETMSKRKFKSPQELIEFILELEGRVDDLEDRVESLERALRKKPEKKKQNDDEDLDDWF